MTGGERAARLCDRIAIDRITLDHPSLPVSFASPDMVRFLFTEHPAGEARASVAMARHALGAAFAVTFGWRYAWTLTGCNREYRAVLGSGLEVVLVAKAAHMPLYEDGQEGAEARELEGVAA